MAFPSWIQGVSVQPAIEHLRRVLTAQVRRPIWWAIPSEAPKELDYTAAIRTCAFVRRSSSNRRICQRRFLKALEEARRTRQPHQFICPIQRYALCLPLSPNGQTQGYLALCHSESAFSPLALDLSGLAVEAALKESERAQELKNLSESIQPRCVALSTVHTIHRLISSTLNLEELIPRVARLCCQVLRAKDCAIWLKDPDKRLFVPRAIVRIQKRGTFHVRPCRVGEGLVGKAALTCQARLAGNTLVVPLVEEEAVGIILVRRGESDPPFSAVDQEILATLAEQAVVAIRNAQMYETQERITWGTIKSLSALLDGMESHSLRGSSRPQILANIALAIADQMRLGSSQQRALQYAALLHDAGRIGIPQDILRKSEKLKPAEFARIKEHPVQGAKVLKPLEILEPAIPIILHHHERYDGTGYPRGLKKEAIPLGARILAVANAFEAMVSHRPYRPAMTPQKAAQEIDSHAGTQFDPKVVEGFLRLGYKRLGALAKGDSVV